MVYREPLRVSVAMGTTYFWPRTYGYGGRGGYFCQEHGHFHYLEFTSGGQTTVGGRMGQVSRTRTSSSQTAAQALTLDSCFDSAGCSTAYVAVTAAVSLLAISSYVIFVLFTLR